MEEAAVNRLATSIARLTLSQVTADEIDAATKLVDPECQESTTAM
jgi:DNA replicative helicase MCM subunit Mcm2 (Cdc46/Mcm family)